MKTRIPAETTAIQMNRLSACEQRIRAALRRTIEESITIGKELYTIKMERLRKP